MGLDMYLNKKTYVWSNDRNGIKITGIEGVSGDKVTYIIEEFGYWRKANAIHKWFVENVQNGEDDCKEHYVDQSDIKKLLETVETVLKASKLVKGKVKNGERATATGWEAIMEDGELVEDPTVAKELLPTESGFFFGQTDYDQWYIKDLEYTKKILTEALAHSNAEFYYQSSW